MTERIYYTNSACRTFDAVVTRSFEHDGHPAVVLDRTAFYPTSGGQPFDTGRIGSASVTETLDLGDEVAHVLSADIAQGTAIKGEIDWPRRFDHMQQHSGQHVLSAAFDRLSDNPTISFHMGVDACTIDLAREASPREIQAAEAMANGIVWENRPVSIRFATAEEAAALPLRKDPARGGTLRLIEVADFDLSACGGTHVAQTGTIGTIAVVGAERFKGGTRVTFACGQRALRWFSTFRDAVTGSVRVLSVLPGELPAAVERVQDEAKELRRTIRRLQETLAAREAERLAATAYDVGAARLAVHVLEGWDAAGLKAIASGMTTAPRIAVALLASTPAPSIVIARSFDVPLDANDLLRSIVQQFSGRGGGKADLAQGGFSGRVDDVAEAARTLLAQALQSA